MKKFLLLAVVCCALLGAQAQHVYFIYLQTDNKSPFYLKTGDKVYSSTASGYLIVPKLIDSTYNVVVGKPGSTEARFTISINGKDKGFLLRESGQKLSLFDLQTMALIEPSAAPSAPVSYTEKTDRFTTLLSQAADDPSLLQMVVFTPSEKTKPAPKPADAVVTTAVTEDVQKTATPIQEPPVQAKDTQATIAATPAPAVTPDTVLAVTEKEKEPLKKVEEAAVKTELPKEETAAPEKTEPVADESVYKRSVVSRRSESSTSEGFGLMFTDSADGVIDTIRLLIPNPKSIFQTGAEEVVKEEKRFLEIQPKTPKKEKETTQREEEKQPKKRLSLFGKKEADQADEVVSRQEKAAVVQKEEGCRNNASDNDVARLRRNMVGKSSEEDMIGEAQKYFKSRCFTTQQIKGLSSLLLTSAGRYLFFEAAYHHVSDKEKFSSLQNELWDRNDINRFKALLAQ